MNEIQKVKKSFIFNFIIFEFFFKINILRSLYKNSIKENNQLLRIYQNKKRSVKNEFLMRNIIKL